LGLLQPIADALKLLMKEIIAPTQGEQGSVFHRPSDGDHARFCGLGGDSLPGQDGT
jgi:hypothetical protein